MGPDGAQFVDTTYGGPRSGHDDLALEAASLKGAARRAHLAADLQKAADRLQKRADFLLVLAGILPEDMSSLSPKAYDALMQFVVDASR